MYIKLSYLMYINIYISTATAYSYFIQYVEYAFRFFNIRLLCYVTNNKTK